MAGISSVQALLGLPAEQPQLNQSTMSRKVIAVVGTVNSDTTLIVKRVPDAGESVRAQDYKQSCGGKGSNAAIASFRSCHRRVPKEEVGVEDSKPFDFVKAYEDGPDIDVRLVARIGDDGNGKICRENLQSNGIDIAGVQEITGAITGMSFCVVEQDSGQNRIMSHRGANDMHEVDFYENPDNFLAGVDLLISHLAIPLKIVEQILETAGKANVEIVLNAAPAQSFYRRLWRYLTHLIVNETEAGILSGRETKEVTVETCPDIAELFLKKGAKNVIITLGEHGAYYATRDANKKTVGGHVAAHKVDVKDTTGAG